MCGDLPSYNDMDEKVKLRQGRINGEQWRRPDGERRRALSCLVMMKNSDPHGLNANPWNAPEWFVTQLANN